MVAMIAGKVRGVSTNDNSPLFAGLLLLLMLVVSAFAVWMLLRLCLAFPASVVEQIPAWTSLKRGTLLSHGTRARILLLYVMGVFLNQILVWCVTFRSLLPLPFAPGAARPGALRRPSAWPSRSQPTGVLCREGPHQADLWNCAHGFLLRSAHPQRRFRYRVDDAASRHARASSRTGAKPESLPCYAQETPAVSEPLLTATDAAESTETISTTQAAFEPKAEEGNA